VEVNWDLWPLFPAAIAISTMAMASGVGGAVFFSPLFILVLGLQPKVAIGAALMTELFGFSSGLLAYVRSGLIDYSLGKALIIFAVPAAIIGTLLSHYIPPDILKAAFATGAIYVGYRIFAAWRQDKREANAPPIPLEPAENFESELMDASGRVFRYTVCNTAQGKLFATVGGMFVGMISVGLGELMDFHLVSRCRVPTPVAVATTVFAVVVTVLAASIGHMYDFAVHSPPATITQVLSIVTFTIPGALIGGQIGPRLQQFVPPDIMKLGLSALFVLVGCLMYFTVLGH
jgi:uncharacterized membrane protein YfcA